MRLLSAPHRGLDVLAFSPCGRLLAAGGNGPGVAVWDLAGDDEPRHYPRHDPRFRPVTGLAFAPDGWLAAAGGYWLARFDPTVDPPPDLPRVAFDAHPALAPDGRRAVVRAERSGQQVLVQFHADPVAGGWVEGGDPLPVEGYQWPAGLLPAGTVVLGDSGGLALHPGGGGFDRQPAGQGWRRLAVAPVGRAVAVAGGGLGVWRPGAGWVVAQPAADAAVGFFPDGRSLLVVGTDGLARVYNAEGLNQTAAYDFGLGRLRACAVAPDGLTAAVASATRVAVFDLD